ncbi:MAG TPA: hypothetical protein PLZ12_00725 [Saprospiraceae bacterium]|nr:hypothetical protein [Saprospiraceae bacterium]
MLLLLSDIRKKLMALWFGLMLPSFLFFLLQMSAGKYQGMEGQAWLWIFVQWLPGAVVLFVSALALPNRGKMILRPVFLGVAGWSGLFGVVVWLAQAGTSAGAAGYSLSEAVARSYTYLLPLQAVLLGVWGLLFFKKESLLLPSAENQRAHAQNRLEAFQRQGAPVQQRALDLFVAGDLPAMLEVLNETLQNGPHSDSALMLKSRLIRLQKKTGMGVISDADAGIEYNKISLAALELVEVL